MNKFLKSLPAVLVLLSSGASAQTDELCLGVAKFAEVAADLRQLGRAEADVIADMLAGAPAPKRSKELQKALDARDVAVINWVYTVRPSPADARAMVYAKCMAGGLGAIDFAKIQKAGRTK